MSTMNTKNDERFVCCFCLNAIAPARQEPIEMSVLPLGPEADLEAGPQGLYSHYHCLRERVSPSIPLAGDPN